MTHSLAAAWLTLRSTEQMCLSNGVPCKRDIASCSTSTQWHQINLLILTVRSSASKQVGLFSWQSNETAVSRQIACAVPWLMAITALQSPQSLHGISDSDHMKAFVSTFPYLESCAIPTLRAWQIGTRPFCFRQGNPFNKPPPLGTPAEGARHVQKG